MRTWIGSTAVACVLVASALFAPQIAGTLTLPDNPPAKVEQVQAPKTPVWSREACGAVCTVRYSPGGYIDEFLQQAWQVKLDDITLKIDGECISACTIAADKARPNVCITKRAVFRFHQGFRVNPEQNVVERFDPSALYSRDISRWVKAHGGFPGKDVHDQSLLNMPYANAKAFYRTCS